MRIPVRLGRQDRRIPGWAAMLSASLAQDRPSVVTRDDIKRYLSNAGSDRDIDITVEELVRLGWLVSSHHHGAWAYLPPGEGELVDPYIALRGWKAREPEAVFALAGESAAWHLAYLDRRFDGPIAVWLPNRLRPPYGLRQFITEVRLGWGEEVASLIGPTPALLRQRRLDLTTWASGLPAFGPEALVVQLAARPSSFGPWGDLVSHLNQLASDCKPEIVIELLKEQSKSAWQRAAYLLFRGNSVQHSREIMKHRPDGPMPHVIFGDRYAGEFSSEFRVTDRLIAPLQDQIGKA